MTLSRKTCISVVLLIAMLCTLVAGCGETQTQYGVANYQGIPEEGQTDSNYNKAIFYRNDKKTGAIDPFVLDNTGVDGYYYLYGTEGSIFCYRSQNLMDWEPVGNTIDNLDFADDGSQSEIRRVTYDEIWAPEVVYDAEVQKYYMFFSATPKEDTSVKEGEGVRPGSGYQMLMVAVSDYPDRDFRLVNFKDPASCGEENLHTYNETPGKLRDNGEYADAYPHYYAKYLLFDPTDYKAFADANGGNRGNAVGGYEGGIDPHPYVDKNGDKYLFWVDSTDSDRISAVKMINWLKPDWSTATVLTYHGYYTVEDWKAAQAGSYVDTVSYELPSVTINEGPVVTEHNGKFYLTFSVNSYRDSSYQVAQAVSDNLMGPYRKLTEEEGGILISGGTMGSQDVSGTGHHSFVTVGEQTYIFYHRHDDFILAGSARNHAIDEIKWITVKDIMGNDLDVMYANGPTCSEQPRIEAFSEYKNIAQEAALSGGENTEYLTDGLLSLYKYAKPTFIENIQETTITETTTFTFDFDSARTVRAVMVYNSKMEDNCFTGVERIELVCRENGQEVIRYIKDIAFNPRYLQTNDYDGSVYYVTPGAAAYAEFDELNVTAVRITVSVPEGQEAVGISEIRILGK